LRAVVLGNQEIGVFYQSFDAGKAIFWPWFKRTLARPEARLLRAHIGIINEEGEAKGKSERKSGSMWSVTFKSDSVIKMPAPNWYKDAENAAGLRLNVLYLDEWTKSMNTGTKGLEEQLMGRTSRECWNQRHPVWRNHRLLSGTAESRAHPAYALVKKYERAIAGGDPNTGHISYSFKDYSDREVSPGRTFRELYRDEPLMEKMQNEWTESHLMEEGFGIWSVLGRGVYSPEALARCVERGKEFGTEVGLAA